MKIKKLLCLFLTLAMLLPTLLMGIALETAATEPTQSSLPVSYVTAGLVALYSGTQNTREGHDTSSDVWEDLVGGNDVNIAVNDKNYFTENGLQLSAAQNYFPKAIVDTVNGDAFTVEIHMADLVSTADAYSTIMNSTNDAFALFRRIDSDVLEFKFAGNAAPSRNTVKDCLNLLQDALITVTYEVGGESVIYINGEQMSAMPAPSAMGAGDLFFGHSEGHRHFDALYRSIRFYNRALAEPEVKRNAAVDGYVDVKDLYVSDGLVSLYSGIQNGAAADAWEDLVGDNDLSVSVSNKSYFNDAGLYVNGVQHYFPQPIVDLVNGNAFTVELSFDEFRSIGGSFNTFLNSKNDNFALFRRNSNNVLEFKFAGNPGNERPIVSEGLDMIDRGTVSVTYEVGGKCRIYVDGVLMSEVASPKAMGADNLFIGHAENSKLFETTYRSIRFYNRVLTAEEIAQNAASDGVYAKVPAVTAPTYISVSQPVTNIVGDIAVTQEINSKEELSDMMKKGNRPAAAIYTLNDKAEILDDAGKVIASFEEMLTMTEYTILPIVVPSSSASVEALAKITKSLKFTDVMILSKDPALVNEARTKMPTVRGAVDFTEAYKDTEALTREACLSIRRTVKSHAASVAVLPVDIASQEMVQYLYDNQINVWVRTSDQGRPTDAELYHALLSGAVGIISDHTESVLDIATALPENTMTRMPLNVGHRGIPSKAPENTIEGAIYAFEHGADCIEIDVYLTRDGEIAVMHDGTTGRTCNKDLSVEGSTWAQLSELYVNKGYENNATYKNCRIPRLKDYLETFKDTDCRLFIEIKTGKTEIVKKIKEAVDAYGMYGQCSVITFNTGIMDAMRRDYPEMSVGALCSGYMGEANPDADMKAVMSFIGKSNSTLNPSYSGYGEKAIRAALIRGIGVFPWTFRGDAGVYQNHFIWGYSGLTGDNADTLKRFVKSGELKNAPATLAAGDTVDLEMLVTYYDHRENAVTPDVILLQGEDLVTVDGSKVTVNEKSTEGTVALVLSHTYRLGGQSITVMTQPQVWTLVSDTEPIPPVDTETPDDPADTEPSEQPTETNPSDVPSDTDPDESESAGMSDATESSGSTDGVTTDISAAEGTDALSATAEDNGGCSSTIGYASLLVLLALGFACVIFKSKKAII